MKQTLLSDLNKELPKKFLKRKRNPFFKILVDSPSGAMNPDKKQLHKRLRRDCKQIIEEELNDQD